MQGAAPQIAQEVPAREYRVAGKSVEATRHETPALVIAGRPALEQQLEELFPISEDRAAFINEIVELVQDAMAQAWALRRLGNRYTPDMVTELSSGSQQTLELLIRDHVSVLRQDVDGVRNRVSPLLSPTPVAAVPSPTSPDAPLPAAAPANDWRSTVIQVCTRGLMADTGRVEKIVGTPHDERRGTLRNGNPSGDFSKAARCGAKTRRSTSCQCPAMKNGRCRLHGGLSTGAKTAEGIERIRRAVTKHGRYSKRAIAERQQYRILLWNFRETLKAI